MRKDEGKICQETSKIKLFEASYGDTKNESQIIIAKRPQIEKVLQTPTAKGALDVTLGHLRATLRVLWEPFRVTGGLLGGSLGTFLLYFRIALESKGHFNIALTMNCMFHGNTHFSN